MATPQSNTTPTDDSIARAKADRDAERRHIEAMTGLHIYEDGKIRRQFILICPRPGCTFTASALTEGRAVRALCQHIIKAHVAQGGTA